MNRKRFHRLTIWLAVAALLAALLACNASQAVAPVTEVSGPNDLPTAESIQPASTEIPTPTPIVHILMPGEPPAGGLSEITDRDSSAFASQHRTNGGENFNRNLYERPFNANSMDTYFPDLDITRTRLLRDTQWVYVNITLVGQNPAGGLLGNYGVELDLNVDGRGEVFLMAARPGAAWSTDGVRVWRDNNQDVGAAQPIQSDPPANTDGYETLVFDQGVGSDPDAAWARISPSDPNSVQVAFKSALINDDSYFTWGAWAMNESMLNPAWFDYNDHFTADEAGSPLTEATQYYPIKALAEVDNTCRWAVGFTPTGSEPGICPVPVTPTPNLPGTISGVVFNDWTNGDLVLDGASGRIAGATVRARSGNCGSPGGVVTTATTNGSGVYTLSVSAGTYCVDVSPDPVGYSYKTDPQTVTVASGGSVNNVNFGYSYYLGMR